MRKSMLLLAALALVMAPSVATSGAPGDPTIACTPGWTRAWDNEDFHCNVPAANDLHVTYYSDTKMRLLGHYDNGFPTFVAVPTGPDSTEWSCTWSGQALVYCQWVHVGVVFEQLASNKIWKKNIYWTLNGVPQGPPYINGPGFTVTPPEGPVGMVSWRLRNNGTTPIIVRNLQFQSRQAGVPLAQLMYNALPGWGAPEPDIPIEPESFFDVGCWVEGGLGNWNTYVMAQGEVVIGGESQGHFVWQHEHLSGVPIPTVTTWGLVVLALVLMSLAVVVVRRTRRAAA